MKITVLVDNNTLIDQYFLGEPALSLFIEDDDKRILFDCGYSDVFIKNANKLGLDFKNLDYLVFSHNHEDHTWGMKHFIEKIKIDPMNTRPVLIAHPTIFRRTYVDGYGDIGMNVSKDKVEKNFDIQLNKVPVHLTDNLIYLGEIPRGNDFEGLIPMGVTKDFNDEPDFMTDDTAMVYKTNKGLVIITGCSHSGICNICEYAKKVCKDGRIVEIIGGLHLQKPEKKQLYGTLKYIEQLKLENLYACHCTDLMSKIELAKIAPLKETGSGFVFEY